MIFGAFCRRELGRSFVTGSFFEIFVPHPVGIHRGFIVVYSAGWSEGDHRIAQQRAEGRGLLRQRVSSDEDRGVSGCSGRDAGAGHSFDDLARGLADGGLSRRRALRLFGAALLGSVMTFIPGAAWAAPCRPGEFQCGRRCCPETFSCVRGQCVCPTGRDICEGGTLEGIDICCPEGYFCCRSSDPTIAGICCPTGTSTCNILENVAQCVPV